MAKQKLMLLIAVAVICIFAMAGVAAATDDCKPCLGDNALSAGCNPVLLTSTNVVKASHTYPLTICSSRCVGCSIEQFTGNDICLEFEQVLEGDAEDQFDLTPAIGVPVYIKVEVMCGTTPQTYYLQTIPRVDTVNRKICFTVQRQNIACASGTVTAFCIEGLKIKTTHVPNMTGRSYNVTLSHKCWGTLCYDLKVVQTVGQVELTGPANCVIGGTNATVQGRVWATCGVPWDKATWPVIIEIKDKKGRSVYGPHDNSVLPKDCCTGKDLLGTVNPCKEDEPIQPVIVHTDANGFFSGQIMVPACGYDWDGQKIYDFVITARTPEVTDSNGLPGADQIDKGIELEYFVDPSQVPAEGCEDGKGLHVARELFLPAWYQHAYLKSNSVIVNSCPGTPYTVTIKQCPKKSTDKWEMNYKKPNKVTFCLVDKFGRETVATSAVELKLWSWKISDCTMVGGVFKNGMDAPGFPATVIDKAWIMPGATCVDVYFYPTVQEKIGLEGRFIINGNLSAVQCAKTTIQDEPCSGITVLLLETAVLEALPKVEGCWPASNPVAGWPILTAIWLQDQNGNPVSVGEDLTAYVQFKETGVDGCLGDCAAKPCTGKVDYLTWDTALKPDGEQICFNQKGAFRGYADKDIKTGVLNFPMGCETCKLDWDTFVHPYCNKKTYIWIYPNWDDNNCLKSAAGKTVDIVVTLKRPNGDIVTTNTQTLYFESPVELTRFMDSETWQTISTPKYLANPADCTKYGTFADLLEPGSWKVIVEYDETQGWIPRSGSDIVEPLRCYWVKTTQPLCPVSGNDTDGKTGNEGRKNYWVAKYIFARASDMSDSLPPVRTLNPGWNSVGMAVSAAYSNCCDKQDGLGDGCDWFNFWNTFQNEMRYKPGIPGYTCNATLDCMDEGCTIEGDYIYRALGSICNCCKLVYNPGGAYGNLAGWSTLAVSQGTAGAWWLDPEAPVFNGDNYWIYINDTCLTTDLAAGVGLEIVDP